MYRRRLARPTSEEAANVEAALRLWRCGPIGARLALVDRPFLVHGTDWTERALRGTREELAAQLRAIAAEGIDRVEVGVVPYSPAGIEELGRVLELL
ncbi:MAG: hypothetical protein ABIG85_05345 [Chloroflexota bacterium]